MNNNDAPQELIDEINSLPVEMVLAAQCASVCSCFISGAYISATSKELLEELFKRHKGNIDKKSTKGIFDFVINYGLDTGVFTKEPNNKITPTEMGWFIGKDWDLKMRHNSFSVGV